MVNLLIVDGNINYGRFLEHLISTQTINFQAYHISDLTKTEKFIEENNIGILLINSDMVKEIAKQGINMPMIVTSLFKQTEKEIKKTKSQRILKRVLKYEIIGRKKYWFLNYLDRYAQQIN
jgi:hypothetical protein